MEKNEIKKLEKLEKLEEKIEEKINESDIIIRENNEIEIERQNENIFIETTLSYAKDSLYRFIKNLNVPRDLELNLKELVKLLLKNYESQGINTDDIVDIEKKITEDYNLYIIENLIKILNNKYLIEIFGLKTIEEIIEKLYLIIHNNPNIILPNIEEIIKIINKYSELILEESVILPNRIPIFLNVKDLYPIFDTLNTALILSNYKKSEETEGRKIENDKINSEELEEQFNLSQNFEDNTNSNNIINEIIDNSNNIEYVNANDPVIFENFEQIGYKTLAISTTVAVISILTQNLINRVDKWNQENTDNPFNLSSGKFLYSVSPEFITNKIDYVTETIQTTLKTIALGGFLILGGFLLYRYNYNKKIDVKIKHNFPKNKYIKSKVQIN